MASMAGTLAGDLSKRQHACGVAIGQVRVPSSHHAKVKAVMMSYTLSHHER